jgi:hypothetical protein
LLHNVPYAFSKLDPLKNPPFYWFRRIFSWYGYLA